MNEENIYRLFVALAEGMENGTVNRECMLEEFDFILHRAALNVSGSLKEAANKLEVPYSSFLTALKRLGLFDLRYSELNKITRRDPSVITVTLPMAQG